MQPPIWKQRKFWSLTLTCVYTGVLLICVALWHMSPWMAAFCFTLMIHPRFLMGVLLQAVGIILALALEKAPGIQAAVLGTVFVLTVAVEAQWGQRRE